MAYLMSKLDTHDSRGADGQATRAAREWERQGGQRRVAWKGGQSEGFSSKTSPGCAATARPAASPRSARPTRQKFLMRATMVEALGLTEAATA